MGGLVEYTGQTLFLGAYDNVWHYYWRTDGKYPLFLPEKNTHATSAAWGKRESLNPRT